MPDPDGYPTEAELVRLQTWPDYDPVGWLEYARSIWFYADWGWPTLDSEVSTGGWSGNEDIIAAMRRNALWAKMFVSVRPGGHYTFRRADADT